MADLVVVGQDPRFGGGALAQTDAFLAAARGLGHDPELVYVPHPTLAGRRWSLDRIEAVRLLRGARALAPRLRGPASCWVVATIATQGAAAPRAGRSYSCWIGTTLDDEWPWLSGGARRLVRGASVPALRRLERATLRGATAVYATSPASRRAVARAAGRSEGDVGILPIPVDVEALAPEPDERWRARLDRPTLAFLGRGDDRRKNLALLLDALPLIRGRLPAARLRLIGGGAPATLPAGAETLGRVPSVAGALRECALLVVPSLQEGFGIAAAEALACGVPVLATPCGGPEHLLRSSGAGRVLETFEPEELAAAAVELLEDADTLCAMRSRGREHVVREHSPERFRELLAAALD